MSIERKANYVLDRAKKVAEKAESWADFSAAVFGQFDGIVAQTFPEDIQRQAFYDSEQYKQVQSILTALMRKFGVASGGTPGGKSGKFVVRIPKTIHQKLDIEAKREGVSLNQLAAVKLAVPLPRSTDLAKNTVIEAFNSMHEGFSPDWVVVEPHHNSLFLARCRDLGLAEVEYTDFFLNHILLNTRKTNRYIGLLNPTTKPSGYKSYDDCAFAAEIAVRTIQRTEGVTLDRILCDPALRERFDKIAGQLVKNTVIKLRCAALNLRKTHKLKKSGSDSAGYELKPAGYLNRVSLSDIAESPGLYALFDDKRPIFAGETKNLYRRIELHKRGGLPGWVDGDDGVILKVSAPQSANRLDRLNWLRAFINMERPLLNYQGAAWL